MKRFRISKYLRRHRLQMWLVVACFGMIGLAALRFSMAATYSVSAQAEKASLSGNVSVASNVSASDNSALSFGGPATLANPVISRGVPAFASSGTASRANDADYGTVWKSAGGTANLAYDLSKVPANYRQSVLLVWYNDRNDAYQPDFATWDVMPYEYPKNYTIEINTAAGGGTAPTSGWVVKATVANNIHHSYEHIVNMAGANWIRINVSSVNGSTSELNMDVYPSDIGSKDDWFFFGSSTPSMSLQHNAIGSVTKNFSQMINAAKPNIFPVQHNGNTSGMDTNDGVKYLPQYLAINPGSKYVVVGLGANDADICMSNTEYYNNMVKMINMITTAGKTPVVPLFNWSPSTKDCGQRIVDTTKKLWTDYPAIVHGPDFWTYFKAHPELVSSDGAHPTTAGLAAFRTMWGQQALATVYK